ncbi:MAG TPA: hypothetical protein P5205_18030 [Candidatus Paceibacterota bacterium]|nr:hypothetical protein [Verrucomicrobiota bacterium]HSA12263.1 hypothetical protein [Candidatus Paceibacterota bacterium]
MKKTAAAAAVVGLALWLGYYLGHHDGIQQERRAWLATEQTHAPPTPAAVAGRPAIQTSRLTRTFYTYPHSGGTFIASKGPAPLNQPDPRNTPVR